MIRDFWVENYLSIRDRQELSFVSKTKDEFVSFEIVPGVFLNKLGILYGANASGKSNMLVAIRNIFELLSRSRTDIKERVLSGPAFELTKAEPIKMHISFYANAVRYDYDIEYCSDYIIKESLFYYPNNSKALFYERFFKEEGIQADIRFGASLGLKAKTQETLIENTLNNHSVLSTYRKVSLKEDILPLAALFQWLERYIHQINGDNKGIFVEDIKDVCNDPKRRKFYQLMLKKADLNIADFRIITSTREIPQQLRKLIMEDGNMSEERKRNILESMNEEILFINTSTEGSFNIPSDLQSAGTLHYIETLHFLYDLITGNHIYLLDELDEDLHYDLVLYILNIFLYNSKSSQLIFTSQETALLEEELLNEHRDLIWFVEKNHATASSEYSRADSFGLHKNHSLYRSYKIGRLGAKPELGSYVVNLD